MTHTRSLLFAGLALLAAVALGVAEDEDPEPPFPAGTSTHEIEGLACTIVMPDGYDLTKEHSLVVILHGAGGTATGMAGSLAHLAKDDYVVLAPKSAGQTWAKKDLDAVKVIVADLKKSLNIGKRRLHGAGFSNGGWNLAPVALDPDLRFASACWIAAGYTGGKFPKHAKKEMGVLALAGAQDANRNSAEQTVPQVEDDVRMAEVRLQPKLGHKWPDQHIPYYGWWLGVQEDRYVPGVTMAFDWQEDHEAALAAATEAKQGAFCYWYAKADAENDVARFLQNDVMQDPAVRFYGNQLVAWKRSRDDAAEDFAALEIKSTPAFVVYDKKGAVKKVLQGKLKAKKLASALKSVAKVKKRPK